MIKTRLILVYNPNSSKYCHVKKDVLARTEELVGRGEIFYGYEISEFVIRKTEFKENVARLISELHDGDTVLALGGDATAAIAANAILESGREAKLAVLPYGNFNDLARTLRTMNLKELHEGLLKREVKLYPLEIYVDGEFWRYATCYVTIGMTAEAVELFDEPKFRKRMQKGHKSSVSSYIQLAKWYFKNRHKRKFLPDVKVNGKIYKGVSDYAAVSGKSMCRVMRGGEDFMRPRVFRSKTAKLTSFFRLFDLMFKSILFRVPGEETERDVLEFLEPFDVELQAEGEYQVFKNAQKIEVKKGRKWIKVAKR